MIVHELGFPPKHICANHAKYNLLHRNGKKKKQYRQSPRYVGESDAIYFGARSSKSLLQINNIHPMGPTVRINDSMAIPETHFNIRLMKKMRRIQVGWLQILGKLGIISISRGAVLCCYAHQKYIACKRTLPQNWMEITRTPWNQVLTFLEHGRCPASYTWRKSNCFKSTWKDFLKISMLIISSYQSGQGANGHGSKARNDVQHRNQEHKGKAKCAKTGN